MKDFIHPDDKYKMNWVKGEFADPYANDQDWAMYFYLRHIRERGARRE